MNFAKKSRTAKSTWNIAIGCSIAAATSLLTLIQQMPVQRANAAPTAPELDFHDAAPKESSPKESGTKSSAAKGDLTAPSIVDSDGKTVKPSAVLAYENDLYFLSPDCLWKAAGGLKTLSHEPMITVEKVEVPKSFHNIPRQELCNFVLMPARKAIICLDKSGDLYEYQLQKSSWQLFRANLPFTKGQPDPEFIDLATTGAQISLLDPERNQIWQTNNGSAVMRGYLPDILPWRVKPGDAYVGDGLSIAHDQTDLYILKKAGIITKYSAANNPGVLTNFVYRRPTGIRPSRLVTAYGTPLYVVERENNRVCAIDKMTGKVSVFTFPADSDIRGLIPGNKAFWLLNNGKLCLRKLDHSDGVKAALHRHGNDPRLDGMIMPIGGVRLPRHVGVFPGARRLYRFGIHEGMDLFYDPGSKTKVTMGTPARAADAGKVLRADADFKDMTYAQFNRVMNDCYREHRTSAANEDLFRGCQVWISHGGGLVTKYAHLVKINPVVKKEQLIERGAVLGYVGVSGTGQNLPGRVKFPHLHFEIWLDGKYLGWGLTPAETMGVYEDIFGSAE